MTLFLSITPPPTVLPSFPTRRSSDLLGGRARFGQHPPPIVVEVALERSDLAVRDQPQPIGAGLDQVAIVRHQDHRADRKSTRLNSSHLVISYAVFCLKKKKKECSLSS